MIKNTYLRCALVLGCICIGSAALIGGLNTVAEIYKETHKSTQAPAEIQDLKPGAKFVEVDGFTPTSSTLNSTKVTLNAVYSLEEGGKTTGYAYNVNCGKPVKTDVVFTVLFEGPATEANKNSIKPTAINIVVGGDSGYDTNVVKLAEGIVAGSATANDYSNAVAGGTKSQKFFIDGVQAARNDYVARINGGSIAPEPQKTPYEEIYGESFKKATKDESFVALSGTTAHCSYQIEELYEITLKDSSVTWAYTGSLSYLDPEEETDTMKIVAGFSGSKTDVKFDGYKTIKGVSYNEYKSWLKEVQEGSRDLDDNGVVEAGGTMTLDAVRDMLRAMRDHYAANYKTSLEKLYGESYVSESIDEFTSIKSEGYDIDKRYTVTLSDGTGKAYEGTAKFIDPYEDTENTVRILAAFSGSESDVKLNGYKVIKDTEYNAYTKWLDGIKGGTTDINDENAVSTGATVSTRAVRNMLIQMRADYVATLN